MKLSEEKLNKIFLYAVFPVALVVMLLILPGSEGWSCATSAECKEGLSCTSYTGGSYCSSGAYVMSSKSTKGWIWIPGFAAVATFVLYSIAAKIREKLSAE